MNVVQATQAITSEYNGWSNRETWLASLWLSNDESSYSTLTDALRVEGEVFDQADWLEQQLRQQLDCELDQASLWQDLLQTAFSRINWVEVIEKNLD
ncbi:MAG: hypothetical protein ABI220_04345 [Candidatus Saccharimonadales bacterium]